jgi:oligopeptide transport system ATP-binding protein
VTDDLTGAVAREPAAAGRGSTPDGAVQGVAAAPALEVTHLHKVFAVRGSAPVAESGSAGGPGLLGRGLIARRASGLSSAEQPAALVAVDDVSFSVPPGRSLAVVGESGSGKTTIARMIVGLERPTGGRILVAGRERSWRHVSSRERKRRAREVQIVFQDPYSSLDPRQTVRKCIDEVLRLHFDWDVAQRSDRIERLLDQVGLDQRQADALPRGLSGGQRQRAAIARALACEPDVVICDEAVASLDVSIQAQVLNLMSDIREETGVTYLFISHDLAVVRQVSDDVIVMRKGRIVESGPTDQLLDSPREPYTQQLLAAIPRAGWRPTASREVV